jgi:hypothetical protein
MNIMEELLSKWKDKLEKLGNEKQHHAVNTYEEGLISGMEHQLEYCIDRVEEVLKTD